MLHQKPSPKDGAAFDLDSFLVSLYVLSETTGGSSTAPWSHRK